jgi:uncharacterized membrane protein YphA (DoxX/SURF4 family)
MRLRTIPMRLATGAYILHEGLGKLHAEEERAKGLHAAASGAYPFLAQLPPERFTRLLAIGEITVGSLLLTPFVPARLAGAALTAFSGGLVTMYLRTPAMHEPGSVWPTREGMTVSKDVWMLGIGLSLLADSSS